MVQSRAIRRTALVLLRGVILIAAVTSLSYWMGLNSASAALVYLIAVVLQSLDCRFSEAAVISLLSVVCLDYFFMEPPFSLRVAHPLDLVTLACLLAAALIVTRIQSRSRAEAAESKLQRANMERLYKLGEELLVLPPGTALGPAVLRPFLSAFDLAAVSIFDAAALESYNLGDSRANLEAKTRAGYINAKDAVYPENAVVVRRLNVRDATVGAIGFEGLSNPELTAAPLTALAAAVVSRARAFQSAADSAAQARTEMLRSAILDALAHEIKTPLATILYAAGGIGVAGPLQPRQAELAEMIETEASRLGELTSRLLRLARLDSEDVRPRLEWADAAALIEKTIRRYAKLWPNRKISFRNREAVEVSADPDLILLAIGQLLENACKYSPPDARVSVDVGRESGAAVVTVWNDGPPIPAGERGRIFERFYRGAEARRMGPGSGLGLFVARKIALAHGGDLALANAGGEGVGLRLTIPALKTEASGVDREQQTTDR